MSPSEVDSTKDVEKKPSQRRINKPLIEKRRRARINDSLAQLKSIVLEASDSKGPRPSKLEKADILEMTVEFIKKKSTPQLNTGIYCNENLVAQNQDEYSAGYSKCLSEISKYLEETRSPDNTSSRLLEHISQKFKPADEVSNEPQKPKLCNDKVRIEPLRKNSYIEYPDKTNQAVDLSMRGAQTKETDSAKANLAQNVASEGHSNSTPTGHMSNQQVPVGLVCGSHVMLLVQLPQTMASQQMLKPNVISLNPQMQTIQSAMPLGYMPMTQDCSTSVTMGSSSVLSNPTIAESAIQNQQPGITTGNFSKSSPITKNCEVKPEAEDLNPDSVKQNLDNISGTQTDKNHWRPW